jgi:PRC-barrel domain
METETALSYQAAVPGTPVYTRSGKEIGTLEHVLEDPGQDLFDGIVVATDWGLRFIDADHVEMITIRNVRCRLDDAEAAKLPPPDGAAVYRVSALDEIGDSLHERLGQMFHRPHWTGE